MVIGPGIVGFDNDIVALFREVEVPREGTEVDARFGLGARYWYFHHAVLQLFASETCQIII